MTATFIGAPGSKEGIGDPVPDEGRRDFFASARVCGEAERSGSWSCGKSRTINSRYEVRASQLGQGLALGIPSGLALNRAQAHYHTDISQGFANCFARVALRSQTGDLRFECPCFAVDSARRAYGRQFHA
jgi:hypothetical protein